ncbi:mitochondrial import receptor subunit Tom22-domain-containing protein [Limtongia smithiae]|uniref:mitochondrial import receptor subunit Tom22-domain-containing protein n=1 Tax=Limtongia smithiae TaxID=1125753 RepID=UPI0034CF5B03
MVQITPISADEKAPGAAYEDKDEDYEDVSSNAGSDAGAPNTSTSTPSAVVMAVTDSDDSDSDASDSDSDYDDDEDAIANETFLERVYALREIVPPQYRPMFTSVFSTSFAAVDWSLKASWVLTTSVLFVAAPLTIVASSSGGMMMGGPGDMAAQAQEAQQIIAPGSV